ncbi:MAG: type II toxin-antitoxin system VapC family toxin [Kofleriaceae bacterium]|nr:type II toxin-antitoxin system VapC family toxin [Kofleriaceae bacterium]
MRLSLDTSAYSHFKRGHDEVAEILDTAEWIGVTAIVLGELRAGFGRGKRRDANERELTAFLRNPSVQVLAVDDDAARIYAEIVVALRVAGTPIPTNDIWIAAVSAREGASVLTFDDHFRKIARVGTQVLTARSS